ncbi:glycosyl hydrolase family 65 protein [Actinosynnema sp. NPDC051121]
MPRIDDDPRWTVGETSADPLRHRVAEALFTLGAGGIATRGAVEEPRPDSVPAVLATGVYAGRGHDEHLLCGPLWTVLDIDPAPGQDRHLLDLSTGTLLREEIGAESPLRTLRFASIVRPGVVALRAAGGADRLRAGRALRPPPGERMATGVRDDVRWAQVSRGAGITAVARQQQRLDGDRCTVERLAVYAACARGAPEPDDLAEELAAAELLGFDRLLAEHRQAWADRWNAVDVELPDDPEAELALRFALFQLWGNTGGHGEAAVGARGVSGSGYSGHVFWDADVFVLPAVMTMDPGSAAAMVDYRWNRLPAARAAARAAGRSGARFPWESASDGADVTPVTGHIGGREVPIATGRSEEHITADVAWAAWRCAQWSGRRLAGRARRLLLDTAEYWASRVRLDSGGHAHIDGVIGPDEYHEAVSDNAFTNGMARWNLRTAARLLPPAMRERARGWVRLASALVDGYDADTGVYEQFAGYFTLEPLLVTDVARPPVAADVLLGPERVSATQIIKQPDVLMLHHLLPTEVVPGSLGPNLDFYGPRTAHGSSLSPAISAALLARAGRAEEALAMLRIALRLDLDDLTGTTADGLHLAAMGGAWQALLFGFAGVRVADGVLHVDPVLPRAWRGVGIRFHCLGRRIALDFTSCHVRVKVDAPLRVAAWGQAAVVVTGSSQLDR